jgi:uncharacterized protein YyaL (SSP411 family)
MLRFSPKSNLAHLIHWSEWEDQAFRKAREEDKPVMLFLSAFWCRYCQRMDEGALSDRENMALLNAYFSALRVENATRPDIDARYNLNGWPTIAFFTPDGELLAAANFLPPEEFKDLLLNVYLAYQSKSPEERRQQPASVREDRAPLAACAYGESLTEIANAIMAQADRIHGGYGHGQKFIHPAADEFLLALFDATQQAEYLEQACRTLDHMRAGQIHDTERGGYFRTTTGADWTQPHREKLLNEHAGLLANWLHALRLTGRSEYGEMAEEIIGYLDRTLFDPHRGAFFGCEDFLRREGAAAAAGEFFTIIDQCVYSDANAQAAGAYLNAASLLGRDDCRARALGILEFIWCDCRAEEDGVFHYHDGVPRLAGLLEDQVRVGTALIQAHSANGGAVHLDRARQTADWIIRQLKNPSGGYFDSTGGEIALRKLPFTDLDQNGAAARFFLRLARASGDEKYREAARWAIDAFAGNLASHGIHAARFGTALLEYLNP